MIQFNNVSKSFNGKSVLSNVSFEISNGTCMGIAGKSGEGKSTILRLMNGLEHVDAGQILVEGVDVTACSKKELQKLRHSIGVVFQDYNLVSNYTVAENLKLPIRINKATDYATVGSVLEFVGLSGYESYYPAQLSGGQKQRVAIARALISKPSILLCDEITSALDDNTAKELLEVIAKVQSTYQMTVVYVTHRLSDLQVLADSILVLEGNEIVDVIANNQKKQTDVHHSYRDYVKAVFDLD